MGGEEGGRTEEDGRRKDGGGMITILREYSLMKFSMRLTSIPSLNCILAELANLYKKEQYFMIPSDKRSLKGSLAGSFIRFVLLF